jgi:hypothetical protein
VISRDNLGTVVQRFTPTTAVLNLLVCLAALIGPFAGPDWFAIAGPIGVLAVTGWTVYAAWRSGLDPFPDLRDVLDLPEHPAPAELAS